MNKAFDLTNKKFGTILVIHQIENNKFGTSQWKCKCEACNKELILKSSNLKNQKSCGCQSPTKFQDLTGKIFGKLKVIKYIGVDKNRNKIWECICEACGKTSTPLGTCLTTGKSKSCGCMIGKTLKYSNREDSLWKKIYTNVISSPCKTKSLQTNIHLEFLKTIVLKPCFYCGIEHSRIQVDNHSKHKEIFSNTNIKYNGLDRVDSNKDYFEDNVVPCCGNCNNAKMDLTQEEFYQHIIKIYEHSKLNLKNIKIPELELEQQKDFEK